jgi:probable HAF family extracellular repeat protein
MDDQDLGSLGGHFSEAYGINASGAVVGYSYLADNSTYHAFLWTAAGGMQDLGAPTGTSSVATAINDRGQIVGYSQSAPINPVLHALLWSSGVMRDLGTLRRQEQ